MDSFLSNSHNNKPTTNNNNNNSNKTPHEHKISTSELFSSAKILAEAAKGGGQKLDKDKVADAAGDLLCAASQYGKLDETSAIGKYVHQAEEYLHNYHSSSSPSSTTTNTMNTSHSTPNTNSSHSIPNTNTNTSHSNSGSDGGGGGHAGSGGYGDYMKMAEGLFKKK